MTTPVDLLVRRNIFASEQEAIHELVRDYILRQINALQTDLQKFERKYGMSFQRFTQYLHERSLLLENKTLPADQLAALGNAIMLEEEDWLDWKSAGEMLENWMGLRQESDA